MKKGKTRDQILEGLKTAEGEEGRTGLVEAFLESEKKEQKIVDKKVK